MTGAGPTPPEREAHTGERRVTLDLDDAEPLDAVRAERNLTAAGAHEVAVRVSSSGEGFHVRAWFDAEEVDEADVERLRLGNGDHVRRVDMDRRHALKPAQVLFTRKPDGEAGAWHEDPHAAASDLRRRSDRYGLDGWRNGEVRP